MSDYSGIDFAKGYGLLLPKFALPEGLHIFKPSIPVMAPKIRADEPMI